MTSWLIVLRSLSFHRRMHIAVALGVAAATAVLTGALLVGDSVRGSLRELALDRLGKIDEILVVDRFFRAELAAELASEPAFDQHFALAVPAILFPTATAERTSAEGGRASNVLVFGTDANFWKLAEDEQQPKQPPAAEEVILNAALAGDLGAAVGDTLVLRFPKAMGVPEDSALGRTDDRLAVLPELKVIEILPDAGLGRFSLQPTQTSPRNAFVNIEALQDALEEPGRANTLLVSGNDYPQPPSPAASDALAKLLHPRLEDLGLHIKHVRRTFGEGDAEQVIYDYYSLTSDRLLLDDATVGAALEAFQHYQPQQVLTYLSNSIEKPPPSYGSTSEDEQATPGIPYSTIAAIEPGSDTPLVDAEGKPLPPMGDDDMVLTSWAAEDQGLKVGDRVRVTYFEPETTHGQEKEASAQFSVAAIVPLTEPSEPADRRQPAQYDKPPTTANDPDLTPEVEGITDKASIDDWDAPFNFDYARIRSQDDEYWENHRTTPKAFVSLRAGQRLWGSRFGKATSVRIAGEEVGAKSGEAGEGEMVARLESLLLSQLAADHETLGFDFVPIRRRSLEASAGTTPFDVLFLLLSMFVIAAAILLVWLLFRLGVDQRASEVGLLLAQGWTRGAAGWLLTREGLIVAAVGAAIGVLGGIGYAWLMIMGLTTWWVDAISSPFLRLHITPLSLIIGYSAGLLVCSLTIWLSLRALRKPSVRQLLAGETTAVASSKQTGGPRWYSGWGLFLAMGLYVAAIALAALAVQLSAEAQAGAFLSAGAAVLAATLMLIHRWLRRANRQSSTLASGGLGLLALRSAGRNVGRSVATVALVASATFLIVAVSSFRLDPTERGTGGFTLLGETSQPLFADLNTAQGRDEALAGLAKLLDGSTILSLRLRGGDDASCRNLYQPAQPRVLGVPPAMVEHFGDPKNTQFAFSATAAQDELEQRNPWTLLDGHSVEQQPVPVILDQNTALYSLRLYGGVGQTFTITYPGEQAITFRIVGLLSNSVLQGSLLISEENFERRFPEISGYRVFLIDTPAERTAEVAALLEKQLSDEGFDAVDARRRLQELLAVQNTYISTFQSLGALGLVLGTFGLAAVQLRSVFERRKELALLRAAGFRRARLGQLVMLENLVLLVGGLLTGVLSAAVTVLPHWLVGGAHVPLVTLGIMLGVVLVVGVLTGLLAVRATLNAPLVAALRGE